VRLRLIIEKTTLRGFPCVTFRAATPDLAWYSFDDCFDFRRRAAVAVFVVVIVAGARLLRDAGALADHIAQRVGGRGARLPADVETGKIGHLVRAHLEAEGVEGGVDVPRHGTGLHEIARGLATAGRACGCR